jgi:hypothetical protein
MSSSSFAPSSTRLAAEWSGRHSSNQSSNHSASKHNTEQSAEERAFARRVRSPWWQSSLPLLVTGLFGLALAATAVAAPPTVTVRHMLAADHERAAAALDAVAIGEDYSLPAQWQPALSSPSVADGPFACDPASSAFAC